MKKVVNSRVYDTKMAKEICRWANAYYPGDFHYCEERLYRTKKGNWFIYGIGGALSSYSEPVDGNARSGGEDIKPMSNDDVARWLEDKNKVDLLNKYFPEMIEEA